MGTLDNEKAAAAIKRYLDNACTDEERAQVEAWYADYHATDPGTIDSGESDRRLALIRSRLMQVSAKPIRLKRKLPLRWQIAMAGAAIVLMATTLLLFRSPAFNSLPILPGGNKAVLTLPDGSQLPLAQHQDRIAITAEGIRYADGTPVLPSETLYESSSAKHAPMLTITVPRGGKYALTLEDGTVVHLNAQSELTYPLHFERKSRQVNLIGEAFFDVKSEPDRPFNVILSGQSIEVLGTSFNVLAYPDNQTSATTLIEGKVRVKTAGHEVILNPGEASLLEAGRLTLQPAVDLEAAVAWKDGYFKFNGTITSIMQQVARWYDVDVFYENEPLPTKEYVGKISRSKGLAELMEIISASGELHYEINGRRVTIMR